MIRLYYSRMTFFYYATSLYAVFDNVPPSTIMCGFSVKESQTDAYSIVRQKLYWLYFYVRFWTYLNKSKKD